MYFCFSVDYAFVGRIGLNPYFLNSRKIVMYDLFSLVFPLQKFIGVGFKVALLPSTVCPLNISFTFSFAEDINKAVCNTPSD